MPAPGSASEPGPATAAPARLAFREASARELEVWDDLTVHPAHGHVYQSMAWARHRERTGWRPHFLVGDDGSAVLALDRPWPIVGGSGAYLPRGPIAAGSMAAQLGRLDAVTSWLAARGCDVVASDAEVAADPAYLDGLARIGFRPIEEIQPSRHRMRLALGSGADEGGVFGGIAKSTRQRIRSAEGSPLRVVRHDGTVRPDAPVGEGFVRPAEPAKPAFDRFYDLLLETGERRRFGFGPRAAFVPWWIEALAAGLLVLLEAQDHDGSTIAGLVLYRHGGRLSTVHSADHAAGRAAHPGALHLLRWRAIQLAIREGCAEMDLGGVDLPGARRPPVEGEPMYGLYRHKQAFGAIWVEQAGAHERVVRPWRYRLGRTTAAALRRVRR